ncbi:nuclear transport factor 2 family protein [Hymenobacter cheonanensis]|uniref:nuclear transport factor 2 family protein n=1 Tax=Hymenobacter sp. CA2-7 TaxID=3063993 RepID=UPI002712BD06|nr:nuclear transport factor 2 family protein [Hymenobacter sp. CA2-7]MDO7885991.1 nuclear transport factor 2 family protein [Hymenobacter sp. CA2-7]
MKKLLLLGGLLVMGLVGNKQALAQAQPDELRQRIARLDAEMFAAFNAHDIPKLMSYFTPNLEFYHDKGGLAGFAQTQQGFTQVSKQSPDIHRELVPGSLEVYPVPGYGAIEVGEHRFCHQENGKPDCGTFKFTMLWQQQKDGAWRVARVVSYGH